MQRRGRFFVQGRDGALDVVDGHAEERPRPVDAAELPRSGPRADVRRDPIAALEYFAVKARVELDLAVAEVLVGRS